MPPRRRAKGPVPVQVMHRALGPDADRLLAAQFADLAVDGWIDDPVALTEQTGGLADVVDVTAMPAAFALRRSRPGRDRCCRRHPRKAGHRDFRPTSVFAEFAVLMPRRRRHRLPGRALICWASGRYPFLVSLASPLRAGSKAPRIWLPCRQRRCPAYPLGVLAP